MTATIARLPLDYTTGFAGKPDTTEPYTTTGPLCIGGCGQRTATRHDQRHVRWADQ